MLDPNSLSQLGTYNVIRQENDITGFNVEDPPVLNICRYIEQLFTIDSWSILTIRGGTGCGKSLTVPAFLAYYFNTLVFITEPLIESAQSIASSLNYLYNNSFELGMNLGYMTSVESIKINRSVRGPRVEIMTTAIASLRLQNLLTDEDLGIDVSQLLIIVIDEVHCRNNTAVDEIFGFCVELIKKGMEIILVPMSANINEQKIMQFFHSADPRLFNKIKPSTHSAIVAGDAIKRKVFYVDLDPQMENSVIKNALLFADTALNDKTSNQYKQIKDNPRQDVLMFLGGSKYIKSMSEAIWKDTTGIFGDFIIIKATSLNIKGLLEYTHKLEDSDVGFNKRKIILLTSVIETGVTIRGITIVLVSAAKLSGHFWPPYNSFFVYYEPATQTNINQQIGRCGRLTSGSACILLSKKAYDSLNYSENDSIKQDMTMFLLRKASVNSEDLLEGVVVNIDGVCIQNYVLASYNLLFWSLVFEQTMKLTNKGSIVLSLQKSKLSVQQLVMLLHCYSITFPVSLFVLIITLINKVGKNDPGAEDDTFTQLVVTAIKYIEEDDFILSDDILSAYFNTLNDLCGVNVDVFNLFGVIKMANKSALIEKAKKIFINGYHYGLCEKVNNQSYVLSNGITYSVKSFKDHHFRNGYLPKRACIVEFNIITMSDHAFIHPKFVIGIGPSTVP